MRNKILFILATFGVMLGLIAAAYFNFHKPTPPPVFSPSPNPYNQGIYASGIIESYQSHGENINVYPEVAGTVRKILITEGQSIKKGTPLLILDDSVQLAATEQQKALMDAAEAQLNQLKAQPRKETLAVLRAQMNATHASLRNVQDQLDKQTRAFRINPHAVSRDALDNAKNAVKIAKANHEVAQRQFELTQAGTWIYDLQTQEKQVASLRKAYLASSALLDKYTIKAPVDGTVLAIGAAMGSYVSPQGAYGTYTQGFQPVLVMGESEGYLEVRSYVDEILIHRLPPLSEMSAQMFLRGTTTHMPLEFVRIQPYVIPKIELSNQRQERVDVRVLPIIFRFEKPKDLALYPGQLVDVYMGERNPPHQLSGVSGKNGGSGS